MKRLSIPGTWVCGWLFLVLSLCAVADVRAFPIEASLTVPPSEGALVVRVGFDLQDIHSIDDESETFSFSGILRLEWKDVRLAFDPAQVGCHEKIYNGAFQFNKLSPSWFPQIIPINTAGHYESHGVVLRVKPDGSCVQTEKIFVDARSRFDLRRLPFDNQQLKVRFGILGFSRGEVVLEPIPMEAYDEEELQRISVPEWALRRVAISGSQQEDPSLVSIVFEVHRKRFFLLRLVVVPLLVICILSWSVFWMEQSSLGNRMSASFVGILTAVAYQSKVGSIIPQIAYVTRIHAFLAVSFFFMCATAAINLVVGAYDRKERHELANRIDHVCRWAFPLLYLFSLGLIMLI